MFEQIKELTKYRDDSLKKGINDGNIGALATGIGMSILPLDLVKVATGNAEGTGDYIGAGIDILTSPIAPLRAVGAIGKTAMVVGTGATVGKIIRYGILGTAGAGAVYGMTQTNNINISQQAQSNFKKWYNNYTITLDVSDKVRQVYPDCEYAKLTIDASDVNKIIPVAEYNTNPPPRDIKDMVKGWEQGVELERQKIGNKYYYIAFPCRLNMKRNNEKIWILLGLLMIPIIGYLLYKEGK